MKACTSIRAVLILTLAALANEASAMDLQHYDLDSLAYFSTNIVIAQVSIDGKASISATVLQTLSGSLKPGDPITDLYPFLGPFFTPLPDKARVVLFLDDRPRPPTIFSDANRAKYAVPPSGVYLIDQYDHVHEYFQWDNPGPYIAEGFGHGPLEPVKSPTREEDLKYPTLDDVKAHIAAAVARVAPVRAMLDKTTTREEIPSLLHLVDLTSQDASDCDLREAAAITERAAEKIRALDEPELLLRADALAGGRDSLSPDIGFIEKESGDSDEEFTRSRVNYLLQIILNKKADITERRMAATLLSRLSGWQDGSSKGVQNDFLDSESEQILENSKHVFYDETDDPQLRGLSLNFIDLTLPANVADVRSVYMSSSSIQLRFAIEKAFAHVSGELYVSLHAHGGPLTSRVSIPVVWGCAKTDPGELQVSEEYQEPADQVEALRQSNFYIEGIRPTLINTDTGVSKKIEGLTEIGGWTGFANGQLEYAIPRTTNLPPGRYKIALQVPGEGGMRTGYGVGVTVRKTAAGNRIDADETMTE
jgi:hypothetical protein